MALPVISRYFRERLAAVIGERAPTSVAPLTGTASRATVATSAATAEQVAQRLMALLEDLKTSGVIK